MQNAAIEYFIIVSFTLAAISSSRSTDASWIPTAVRFNSVLTPAGSVMFARIEPLFALTRGAVGLPAILLEARHGRVDVVGADADVGDGRLRAGRGRRDFQERVPADLDKPRCFNWLRSGAVSTSFRFRQYFA
jgi:hypothetical protein